MIEGLLSHRPDPTHPALNDANNGVSKAHILWRASGRGTGMIMALYLVAIKCRDSRIRQRAVELLEEIQLQEGLFSSNLISPFARRVVKLEEGRARAMMGIDDENVLLKCEDVPEQARFLDVTINADMPDPTLGRLICGVWSGDGDGFELVEEWVRIASP